MIEENREHKYRFQNGEAPDYKSLHEVRITKDCGYKTDGEIAAFVQKYIAAFNGHTEEKHGMPIILFERKQDAQKFANELSEKPKIAKENISIKAAKFNR